MCDYQGLVAAPGLEFDPRALLQALGVSRLDFSHLLKSQTAFPPHMRGECESLIIDVEGGYGRLGPGAARRTATSCRTPPRRSASSSANAARRSSPPSPPRKPTSSSWSPGSSAQYRRDAARPTSSTPPAGRWRLLRGLFASRDARASAACCSPCTSAASWPPPSYALQGPGVRARLVHRPRPRLRALFAGVILLAEVICAGRTRQGVRPSSTSAPATTGSSSELANAPAAAWPTASSAAPRRRQPGRERRHYGVRGLAEALPLGPVSDLPGKAMRRIDALAVCCADGLSCGKARRR